MRDDYLLGGMGRTMSSGMWEDRSNCTARGWGRCLPVATEYASLSTFPEPHSLRHRRSSGRAGRHIGITNYHRRSIMTIDKRILRPVTDFRIAWSGCWVAFLHVSCTKMTRRDALPCLGQGSVAARWPFSCLTSGSTWAQSRTDKSAVIATVVVMDLGF